MAEEKKTEVEQAKAKPFDVERVFLEEAALKLFNAPNTFALPSTPELSINLQVDKKVLTIPDYYTISVTATLRSFFKNGDKEQDVFTLTAKETGLFKIQGVEEPTLTQVLGVTCPTIVYPYLRASISDILAHSTLPQVYLAQINFEEIFDHKAE